MDVLTSVKEQSRILAFFISSILSPITRIPMSELLKKHFSINKPWEYSAKIQVDELENLLDVILMDPQLLVLIQLPVSLKLRLWIFKPEEEKA